jgi:Protein of unknown function (DUF2934)
MSDDFNNRGKPNRSKAAAKRKSVMSKEQEKPLADTEREERIRQKAYQLWEEDGSPDGRADEYWHRAREMLDQEPGSSAIS